MSARQTSSRPKVRYFCCCSTVTVTVIVRSSIDRSIRRRLLSDAQSRRNGRQRLRRWGAVHGRAQSRRQRRADGGRRTAIGARRAQSAQRQSRAASCLAASESAQGAQSATDVDVSAANDQRRERQAPCNVGEGPCSRIERSEASGTSKRAFDPTRTCTVVVRARVKSERVFTCERRSAAPLWRRRRARTLARRRAACLVAPTAGTRS